MPDHESHHVGLAAFRHRNFSLYEISRFFSVAALETLSVAVGWQVYEITRRPLDLGLVGLAQFLPNVFLFLVAGHAADRYDRRVLIVSCYSGYAICAGSLLYLALHRFHSVCTIYAVLALSGVVRSFSGPVGRALLPQLVSEKDFINAVAWASSIY